MTRVAFLDIEASGLDIARSYPIEIGFALSTGGDPKSVLIAPETDWTYWDFVAEQIHGISREYLIQDGWAVPDVVTWLRTHLEDVPVYVDAAEDRLWLKRLLDAAGSNWRPELFNAIEFIKAQALRRRKDFSSIRREVDAMHGRSNHRAGADAAYLRALYRAACRA